MVGLRDFGPSASTGLQIEPMQLPIGCKQSHTLRYKSASTWLLGVMPAFFWLHHIPRPSSHQPKTPEE
jgi:hypothetical protein